MGNLEHAAAHAPDDRKALREKVLEICCKTATLSVVHCLLNLEVENTTLKELRSVRETVQEQPADDCCDAGAECCDAPTVQQQIADGRKATTSV